MLRRDAEAHFALLEATPDRESLQPFTTTVHALKSGLASIGANALSESAKVLEAAGRNGDMHVIRDNLASFREELAALTARIGETVGAVQSGADEEGWESTAAALLRENLAELKTALQARDTDGMDLALAKMQNLPLTSKNRAAIDEIARFVLFGDFKKAMESADTLTGSTI